MKTIKNFSELSDKEITVAIDTFLKWGRKYGSPLNTATIKNDKVPLLCKWEYIFIDNKFSGALPIDNFTYYNDNVVVFHEDDKYDKDYERYRKAVLDDVIDEKKLLNSSLKCNQN